MLDYFVQRWEARKAELRERLATSEFPDYTKLVTEVVTILVDTDNDYSLNPDPKNIVEIDHGDYQGAKVFVFPSDSYQPSTYWAVMVYYGSCGYCDTMQRIRDDGDWNDEKPNGARR